MQPQSAGWVCGMGIGHAVWPVWPLHLPRECDLHLTFAPVIWSQEGQTSKPTGIQIEILPLLGKYSKAKQHPTLKHSLRTGRVQSFLLTHRRHNIQLANGSIRGSSWWTFLTSKNKLLGCFIFPVLFFVVVFFPKLNSQNDNRPQVYVSNTKPMIYW